MALVGAVVNDLYVAQYSALLRFSLLKQVRRYLSTGGADLRSTRREDQSSWTKKCFQPRVIRHLYVSWFKQ